MSGAIDFDSIRRSNPIESYCDRRGIQLHKHGGYLTGRCPIHNEQNGEAFAVWPDEGRWQCFGKCSKHGDIVDLEQILGGGSLKEAAERLGGYLEPIPIIRAPKPEPKKKEQFHPDLKAPTFADLKAINKYRSIEIAALKIAVGRGLLYSSELQGHRAYIVTDRTRRSYLARRLDGRQWEHLPSRPKAYLLPGSQGNWPIGIIEARKFPAIAICEGSPDFLSAFGHAWASSVEHRVGPVCMSSSSVSIAEEALLNFASARVRIFVHDDKAGYKAAQRWADQLHGLTDSLDGFSFEALKQTDGRTVKDLNDLHRIDYDCWESNQRVLESVMDFASEGRN